MALIKSQILGTKQEFAQSFTMFISIRKKYLHVGSLVLLLLVTMWIIASALTKSFNSLDIISLSTWSTRPTSKFMEKDSPFNIKVSKLFEERKKHDLEDKYWQAGFKIHPDQTQLSIPDYFLEPDANRIDIQPFDPRFTVGMYYNYIKRNSHNKQPIEVPFHWADWTDMSALLPYILETDETKRLCATLDYREFEKKKEKPGEEKERKALDPASFCKNEKDLPKDHKDGNRLRPGFNVMGYYGTMDEQGVIVAGKSHLYSGAESPSAVIFLTSDGSYTVIPGKKEKLLHNGIVEEYMTHSETKSLNAIKEFQQLKKEMPPDLALVLNDYMINLKHEDFIIDGKKIIKELETRSTPLSARENNYLNSLRYSIQVEDDPPKYFKEAKIFNSLMGDHYDYRFFNGINLGYDDKAAKLHRMTRVWLSFCRKQGITTWLAHGSLLSWYWNGIAFPWDDDIDVQMPIMDLHKLSMNFNQSIIVEDSEDGFGRYFLDCATFITLRKHTNGNNNIDARFIDVDSGFYIDITGLALSDDSAPSRYEHLIPEGYNSEKYTHKEINDKIKVYNCRNKHFTSLAELTPLIKTFAEGEVAYVPKSYSSILTTEYNTKGMLERFFRNRFFVPQLRMWIDQSDLLFFLRHRQDWITYFNTSEVILEKKKTKTLGQLTKLELEQLLNLKEQDLLELLTNDDILLGYYATRDMTSIHENEIMRLLFGKSTENIVSSVPDSQPLKFEPFLYRMRHDYDTFEKRVGEVRSLYDAYLKTLKERSAKAPELKKPTP